MTTVDVNLTVTGEVAVLRLAPGDRVLVTLDDTSSRGISSREMESIAQALRENFAPNEVVVLNGMRIAKEQRA